MDTRLKNPIAATSTSSPIKPQESKVVAAPIALTDTMPTEAALESNNPPIAITPDPIEASSSSSSSNSSSSSSRTSDSASSLEITNTSTVSSPVSASEDKLSAPQKIFTKEEIIAELEKMQAIENIEIPSEINEARKAAFNNLIVNIGADAFSTELLQNEFRNWKLFDQLAVDNAKISYNRTFKTPQREEALMLIKKETLELYTRYKEGTSTAVQAISLLKEAVKANKEAVEKHYKETSWYNSALYSYSPIGLLFPPKSRLATQLDQTLKNVEAAEVLTPAATASRP
jgi:hypothetical protein